MPGKDDYAEIAHENKFRAASFFSSFLYKIPIVFEIWKSSIMKGYPGFHKLLKYNLIAMNTDHLTRDNIITPPDFQFRIKDVVLHEDQIGIIMEDFFQPEEDDGLIMIMLLNPEERGGHE